MSKKQPRSTAQLKPQPIPCCNFSSNNITNFPQNTIVYPSKLRSSGLNGDMTSNLQVVTSKPYQDLLSKLRALKAQTLPIVEQLTNERKNRREQLKALQKDKNKVKLDIWHRINELSRLKQEIEIEKERREMLQDYLRHEPIPTLPTSQPNSHVTQSVQLTSRHP